MGYTGTTWQTRTKLSTEIMETMDDGIQKGIDDAAAAQESADEAGTKAQDALDQIVQVDDTLLIEGEAADAKATGEAIESAREDAQAAVEDETNGREGAIEAVNTAISEEQTAREEADDAINEEIEGLHETDTELGDRITAVSAGSQENISDAFDEDKEYSAGDYAIYNDELYKFIADKGMGTWDESVVERVSVTDEIKSNADKIQENTDLIDSCAVAIYADSVSELISKMLALPNYQTATIFLTSNCANALFGTSSTLSYRGVAAIIISGSSRMVDFLAFGGTSSRIYTGRINSNGETTSLYSFTGTSV